MKASAISSRTNRATAGNRSPRSVDRFCLTGPSRSYDPRVTAARRDIADIALADRLFAPHYARAELFVCQAGSSMVLGAPGQSAVTQILAGEGFAVLDISAGWAWGYSVHDGYVGYVPVAALVCPDKEPTHIVVARSAPVFAIADIKSAVGMSCPIGSRLTGTVEGDFLTCTAGFVHLRHIAPLGSENRDLADMAGDYLGLPYLWGGRGGGGIDCSGLVQQALARIGIAAPRDSDQQRAALGSEIDADAPLRRNDILFFPGHVGIMLDAETIIHANAYWMAVTVEPLADVTARILPTHEQPVLARRRLA